jgi:hypothetical protein
LLIAFSFNGVRRLRKAGSLGTGDIGTAYGGNRKRENEIAISGSINIASSGFLTNGRTRKHLKTSEPTPGETIARPFHESVEAGLMGRLKRNMILLLK